MAERRYIPGYKLHSLLILEKVENDSFLVRCDCGKEYVVSRSDYKKQYSCKECSAKRNTKHGMANSKIYHAWEHIIQRCYNPRTKCFEHYGGRGIKMCEEWKSNPSSFIKWSISSGWSEGLTIDRIDNNGDYCPSNCRWVDRRTQQNNRRNTMFITAFGKTMPCAEWARKTGIPRNTIRGRIVSGWEPELAVSVQVATNRRKK